jgi:signal transduction histidine kinase
MHMGATGASITGLAERKRVEAVVETLAAMHHHGESLGELAHDARNMVTALSLYSDLLEEPGVLPSVHRHYASELRLLAEASRTLVEKLAILDRKQNAAKGALASRQRYLLASAPDALGTRTNGAALPSKGCIANLSAEILMMRDLLAAIAGPSIDLKVNADGAAFPVRMTSEDLIRVLVNLVKNSAESIAGPGTIEITLCEGLRCDGAARCLVLSLEDSGRGIATEHLETIFEPGFTTSAEAQTADRWSAGHCGLGLSITRSIVEQAGGRICAENRLPRGARFVIELPVWDA